MACTLHVLISVLSMVGRMSAKPTLRIGHSGCTLYWDWCQWGMGQTARLFLPFASWRLKPELWDYIIPANERQDFDVEFYGLPSNYSAHCCSPFGWDWPADMGGSGPYVLQRIVSLKNDAPNFGGWRDIHDPAHILLANFMGSDGIHERESQLAAENRIPIIGASSSSKVLQDKTLHPYYLRINPTALNAPHVITKLMSHYNWTRAALITNGRSTTLEYTLEAVGMKLHVEDLRLTGVTTNGCAGPSLAAADCIVKLMKAVRRLELLDFRVIIHENENVKSPAEHHFILQQALVRPGVQYIFLNPGERGCGGAADYVWETIETVGEMTNVVNAERQTNARNSVVAAWDADLPTQCCTCRAAATSDCKYCPGHMPVAIPNAFVQSLGPWNETSQCATERKKLAVNMQGAFCIGIESRFNNTAFQASWGAFASTLTRSQWEAHGMPASWHDEFQPGGRFTPEETGFADFADGVTRIAVEQWHVDKIESVIAAMVAFNSWLKFGNTDSNATSVDQYFFGGEATWTTQPENTANAKAKTWLNHVKSANYTGITGPVSFNSQGEREVDFMIYVADDQGVFKPGLKFQAASQQFVAVDSFVFRDGTSQAPPDRYADCSAGQILSMVSKRCEPCPPGYHAPTMGMQSCILCAEGTYQNSSASAHRCNVCPEGSFCGPGTSNPTPCGMGQSCPVGSAAPVNCTAGTYAPTLGLATCQQCEVGKYTNLEQQTSCISCPEADTTTMQRFVVDGIPTWSFLMGAASVLDCVCEKGSRSVASGDCVLCGEGMDCPGSDEVRIQEGYYSGTDYSVFKCSGVHLTRCKGGEAGETCARGRTGLACAQCEAGKTQARDGSGECKDCGGAELAPIMIVALLAVVVLGIIYATISTQDHTKVSHALLLCGMSLSLMITLVQSLGILSSIVIEWEEPFLTLIDNFSVFALDLGVLNFGCVVSTSAIGRFIADIVVVLLCFVIIVVFHVCTVVLKHGGDFKGKRSALVCVVGTLSMIFYISLSLACFDLSNVPETRMASSPCRVFSLLCASRKVITQEWSSLGLLLS
eukprot:TRINITY_DN6301_c0_g1_i1.p1 TRINITY_DN6301_c0_g1~~TRINITY_DN6301_c0_g1_i1.p1  ORF type:complete len:1048 (-),score=135.39 TRINITY_DN6301_c0_g1_i1:1647-4790(-)